MTLAPGTGALPWIVEQLLKGNSLTFLLLCVTLPGSTGNGTAVPSSMSRCLLWHTAACQPPAHPCQQQRCASPGTSPCSRMPHPLPGHPGHAAPPDTPGEEILAALALAERVKGAAKTVSPTHWDPAQEVAARREEIRGLRTELLAGAGGPEQERAVAQLQRALRELQVGELPWTPRGPARTRMALVLRCPRPSPSTEGSTWELPDGGKGGLGGVCPCLEVSSVLSSFFQVLKSQRWEKKQAATKVFGTNQVHQPSAKVGAGQAMTTSPRDNLGTGEVPRSASVPIMSPLASTGPDLCRDRSTSPKAWDPDVPRRCQPGDSRRSGAGDRHVPHAWGAAVAGGTAYVTLFSPKSTKGQ